MRLPDGGSLFVSAAFLFVGDPSRALVGTSKLLRMRSAGTGTAGLARKGRSRFPNGTSFKSLPLSVVGALKSQAGIVSIAREASKAFVAAEVLSEAGLTPSFPLPIKGGVRNISVRSVKVSGEPGESAKEGAKGERADFPPLSRDGVLLSAGGVACIEGGVGGRSRAEAGVACLEGGVGGRGRAEALEGGVVGVGGVLRESELASSLFTPT